MKIKEKLKRPALKPGNFNVQTMTTGLSESSIMINDIQKTPVSNDELKKLNVDIASPQETWLAGSCLLEEKDYCFLWNGASPDDSRGQ